MHCKSTPKKQQVINLNNINELIEVLFIPWLDAYPIRAMSCASKFFSKSLAKVRTQKPLWQIIPGYEHTLFFNRQTAELYGVGIKE